MDGMDEMDEMDEMDGMDGMDDLADGMVAGSAGVAPFQFVPMSGAPRFPGLSRSPAGALR